MHPPPPADLPGMALPLREVRGPFFRIQSLEHPSPIYFGRSGTNRFDAPAGAFGVLYLGESERAAFIETLGHRTGYRRVAFDDVRRQGLSRLAPRRPLRVVDLTGPNLARLGADAGLFAGPIEMAQKWAAAFYAHPDAPDGLRYPCRHDNHESSVALFSGADRETALRKIGRTRHLGSRGSRAWLADMVEHYGFALVH